MIDSLLEYIKDELLDANHTTFVKGFYGGRQYADGKIIFYTKGEGTYTGLQDTQNNHFYIRYLDDISFSDAKVRTSACTEQQGEAKLRLVAWVNNADVAKLTDVVLNDLGNINWNGLSVSVRKRFSRISPIKLNQIVFDHEKIYLEETKKEQPKGKKNVTLIAFDFTLTFNFTGFAELTDCIDRDVCNLCQ